MFILLLILHTCHVIKLKMRQVAPKGSSGSPLRKSCPRSVGWTSIDPTGSVPLDMNRIHGM